MGNLVFLSSEHALNLLRVHLKLLWVLILRK
jgi:hypothetical protein